MGVDRPIQPKELPETSASGDLLSESAWPREQLPASSHPRIARLLVAISSRAGDGYSPSDRMQIVPAVVALLGDVHSGRRAGSHLAEGAHRDLVEQRGEKEAITAHEGHTHSIRQWNLLC